MAWKKNYKNYLRAFGDKNWKAKTKKMWNQINQFHETKNGFWSGLFYFLAYYANINDN